MPIPKTKAPARETAKDRAYTQIREWIISGTLIPGEKLAEEALADAINVSRTPIREALVKLSEDGFVTTATGRVSRVAPITADAAATLYEPIAGVEGVAAKLAATKATTADLAALTALEQDYQRAIAGKDVQAMLHADRQIHLQILTIADNPYLQRFSDLLYGHIQRYETYFFDQLRSSDQMRGTTHEPLLAALKAKNQVAAKQAMETDWLETMTAIAKITASK